jgi:hypothetical protein
MRHAWMSPVHAGDESVQVVTGMAHTAAPTLRVDGTALVDLPYPRDEQPWVASLGSTFSLLAQEVLELVYQLLRVEVVTRWARHRVTCRVIVLL